MLRWARFRMNWKSTTAVSGATLLATWLGWSPAPPPAAAPVLPPRESAPAEHSDIQGEAARLQSRVRTELDYRDPARNPFRFGPKPLAVPKARAVELAPPPVERGPSPLPFTLSGMAVERAGVASRHTAILTMGADVVFVREGDQVAGFTMSRVDETGVDVTATDGSVRRLTLTP